MGIDIEGRLDLRMAFYHRLDLSPGLLAGTPVVVAVTCGGQQLAFHAFLDLNLARIGGLG